MLHLRQVWPRHQRGLARTATPSGQEQASDSGTFKNAEISASEFEAEQPLLDIRRIGDETFEQRKEKTMAEIEKTLIYNVRPRESLQF